MQIASLSVGCWWRMSLVSANFARLFIIGERMEATRRKVRDSFTVKHEDETGNVHYTLNGRLHREFDFPALLKRNGEIAWCYYGFLSRENDKPALISRDVVKWCKHGRLGRAVDKPSIVTPFRLEYWRDGVKWRRGGRAAVVYLNGDVEYWRGGVMVKEVRRANAKPTRRNNKRACPTEHRLEDSEFVTISGVSKKRKSGHVAA